MIYLGGIFVTETNNRDHLNNRRAVLTKLQKTGLKLKLEKCVFFEPLVEHLEHTISKDELVPGLRKVAAALNALASMSKKGLQSYLGIVNFYRRFAPNLFG